MKSLYLSIIDWFERIPADVIAIVARIGLGTVFLRSGLLKLEGWETGTTLSLFETEYPLPFLSPNVAMHLATGAELVFPFLLFAGLFTRFAALALLVMTLVIQIFVYPNAFDTHGTWAVGLLFLMKYGAGSLSLDYLLFRDGFRSGRAATQV
jgi:putative oxidoreductase